MPKKVFIGVGHGGTDSGAVGYVVEKDANLQMALACKEYLEANNVEVKLSRYKDENDSLNEVVKECNEYKPDLALDSHNNAGKGDGFEGYYQINNNQSKILAENIEKEIIAIGQNSRGIKTRVNSAGTADYYGFLRLVNATAVIVEGAFVDNQADAEQIDTIEEQKEFGYAYARGILKTLGIDTTNEPIKEEGSDEPVRVYQNGRTPEPVYADTNLSVKIGSLNPREKCDCFGIFNNRAMVRYKIDNSNNYKIGFCKWLGGVI